MTEKQPDQHSGEVVGSGVDSPSAETGYRDTARPTEQERNDRNPAERNRAQAYGPRTHANTRIDPDPRFGEEEK